MLYIGTDLGTSAVKLLLMDEAGQIKNIVSKEYPCFSRIQAGRNKIRRTGMQNLLRASGSCLRAATEHRWRVSASAVRCTALLRWTNRIG